MSRSVLSQPNGMTEENLLKFLACYQDINSEWLLFGNEPMLLTRRQSEKVGEYDTKPFKQNAFAQESNCLITELLTRLENQSKEIGRLNEQNRQLRSVEADW